MSNILNVGTVLDGSQGHAEGAHDGYQPVLFTGTTTCTDDTEGMKSMSMKSTCCQSLINEINQEYIDASTVTIKDLDESDKEEVGRTSSIWT